MYGAAQLLCGKEHKMRAYLVISYLPDGTKRGSQIFYDREEAQRIAYLCSRYAKSQVAAINTEDIKVLEPLDSFRTSSQYTRLNEIIDDYSAQANEVTIIIKMSGANLEVDKKLFWERIAK